MKRRKRGVLMNLGWEMSRASVRREVRLKRSRSCSYQEICSSCWEKIALRATDKLHSFQREEVSSPLPLFTLLFEMSEAFTKAGQVSSTWIFVCLLFWRFLTLSRKMNVLYHLLQENVWGKTPVRQKAIAVLRLPVILFVTTEDRYNKLWYLVIFLCNKVSVIHLRCPFRSLLLHQWRYWVEICMKILGRRRLEEHIQMWWLSLWIPSNSVCSVIWQQVKLPPALFCVILKSSQIFCSLTSDR